MPGVKNAFEVCVFTFGVARAGGAGKVLAEWITSGETEWDMWSVDPRRFTGFVDDDYCVAKGVEVYGNEYAMHFPHHEWAAARGRRLSPLHSRLKDAGAVMGAYNGWERANWFAHDGDDTSHAATQAWLRDGPWEARNRKCSWQTGVNRMPGVLLAGIRAFVPSRAFTNALPGGG